MKSRIGSTPWRVLSVLAILAMHATLAPAQLLEDDERRIRWHRDDQVSLYRRAIGPAPVTVATPPEDLVERFVSLDESIQLALQYSEVVRVLTGQAAAPSGSTIYDTAIATTPIDQAKARFDPVFSANSSFRRNERAFLDPAGTTIIGSQAQGNDSSLGLLDLNRFGGLAEIRAFNAWDSENAADFLTRDAPSAEISYTQPLLAGAGRDANEAPIVIARLQQEQSYFQFKGSMQELVRGVVTAYWSLVQARTELWAREIQVEQLKIVYDSVEAQFRIGRRNGQEVAQSKTSYATFRANLIASQANVLQREAALRNLIGLPPEDGSRIVPCTPPTRDQIEFRWDELLTTAQERRPDLIELNLILLADQQRLRQNRNAAQPELNAVALHGWNGLSGRAFTGRQVNTPFDNHTDWTLGVTFEVPLTLRASRAQLRSTELLIARDRANIQQGLHQMEHALATSLRSVDQNFLQYEAFRDARDAARVSIEALRARENAGSLAFLNVLQAITDWGNAVASEAQALTAYNSELASIELQTGTILDTHGIRFVEEQFSSIGTHGRCYNNECYPRDLRPTSNAARYLDTDKPAEDSFNLDDYPKRDPNRQRLQLPDMPVDMPQPDDAAPLPDSQPRESD